MDQPAQGVKAIFDRALEIDTPADRQAFLEAACAGEPTLRDQVESLLRAYAEAGSFLEQPAGAEMRPTPPDLPAADASPPAEGPGTLVGPYQLVELLGEGGMGTVWRAAQQQPVRREVALKVIKPDSASAGVIARFEAERQALALMDHPHIAKVLDAGATATGRPYFVMELVPGVPISQFCDAQRLSLRQRLELFIPVCQAVQHAHQKGLIHRDLKPSNVLVGLYDGKPVPKVIDFGIAKATGAQLTEQTLSTGVGSVVGTLEYMAPEQAELNALDIDTRADIYSLGVLLYELLTGSTPRRGQLKDVALFEVLRLIREHEPERPSARLRTMPAASGVAAARGAESAKLAKQVKGELDWIVLKCLEKDRARRYATANGLARDLERYLADEPVEAGPPSATYRLRKLARRHKGPVLAVSFVLLALVVGIAGTTWGLLRAEQARQVAEAKEGEAQREKRIAEAVRKFQRDLLRQADPSVQAVARRQAGGGLETKTNPTIKELLDRAAAELAPGQIEAKFPEQPAVQASILMTMGETYLGIGEYDKAIAFMSRACDTFRQAVGADHPDSLTSMNNLAAAYKAAGQHSPAIRLLEEVLAKRQQQPGPDHHDTLQTMNNLAVIYHDAGRLDKALPLLEKTLAKCQEKLGPDHSLTLACMNNLAMAYEDDAQLDKALSLYQEVVAKRSATLGPDHPDTVDSLNNLAATYEAAGQFDRALPLLEQVLAKRKQWQGPDHPHTLIAMNNLAGAYRATGQFGKALPLFEETLAKQKAALGPGHLHTLRTMDNLGYAYVAAGQRDKALPLFQEALATCQGALGPDHPQTLHCMNNLAGAYLESGQTAKALPLFEQALAGRRQVLGPDHPNTLQSLTNLAHAYQVAGQLEKALPLLEEDLTQQKKLGGDHPQTLISMNVLAQVHQRMGNFAKAETILRTSLSLRQQKQPDLWVTFYTQALLGASLLGQKKYAEAEPLLRDGYEGMKQREATIRGPTKKPLSDVLQWLVQLYEEWGKQDQAETWRQRLAERTGVKAP
jgi:serine/threonine protein kinase/Tfp pilus assembly protein PilF